MQISDKNIKIVIIGLLAILLLYFLFNLAKPKVQNKVSEVLPKPKLSTDSDGNVYLENSEDYPSGTIIQIAVNGQLIETTV